MLHEVAVRNTIIGWVVLTATGLVSGKGQPLSPTELTSLNRSPK